MKHKKQIKLIKPNKFGDYEKVIFFKVFSNYQVHIVFTNDLQKSHINRYGLNINIDFNKTRAFHKYAKGGHSHIFIKLDDCHPSLIAHECVHAVFALLINWAGCQKELDEELVAYHLEHILSEALDFKEFLNVRRVK